jgi:hypothetical protein
MEWNAEPYWEVMQRLSQMPPATLEENTSAADACTAAVQPATRGQRPYGGLMILASHALLAIKGLRPPGVLDRLPGKLVERLAETCGATPPEVRHAHFATWPKPNTHDTSRKVIILRVGWGLVTNRVPPGTKTATSINSTS